MTLSSGLCQKVTEKHNPNPLIDITENVGYNLA